MRRFVCLLLVGCSGAGAGTGTGAGTAARTAARTAAAAETKTAAGTAAGAETGDAGAGTAAAGDAAPLDRPCASDTAALADARAKLEALDKQIEALKPADNHEPANAALIAMLEHPCMKLSDVLDTELRAEAAPALVEFWKQGGRDWIESQLELGSKRSITVPPAMRKVVSAETRPGHGAFSLLCSLGDPSCGQRARGWWQRAETYFELNEQRPPRGRDVPFATEAICEKEALAKPVAERFDHWEGCVSAIGKIRHGMPLGGFKVPTSGWLIVRGRRGHYSFCDEVRLYSLATGAAYISQSCNQLFVVEGDKVRRGTAADRKPRVRRGSMALANVRETAWMLLHLGEVVDEFRAWGRSYELPKKIEPAKGYQRTSSYGGRVYVVSSDQTTLAWALADDKHILVSGTLRWPTDYRGGPNDHALDLLRTAEAGFVDGCPREKPPRLSRLGKSRPSVSPLDGNADELELLEGDLVTAIDKLGRERCRRERR